MLESFKEKELKNQETICGGWRIKEYHDFDGDGKWDMKVVYIMRGNALVRTKLKLR